MTTKEVIFAFLHGETKGKASGGRLRIEGERLINYETTIAQRFGGRVVINVTKYSATTTKHQNVLRRELPKAETVDGVPIGTYDLSRYRKEEVYA